MQCERFEARLNRLLDARRRPSADGPLRAHAARCHDCRERLTAQEVLFDTLRWHPAEEPPADLTARILDAVDRSAASWSEGRDESRKEWDRRKASRSTVKTSFRAVEGTAHGATSWLTRSRLAAAGLTVAAGLLIALAPLLLDQAGIDQAGIDQAAVDQPIAGRENGNDHHAPNEPAAVQVSAAQLQHGAPTERDTALAEDDLHGLLSEAVADVDSNLMASFDWRPVVADYAPRLSNTLIDGTLPAVVREFEQFRGRDAYPEIAWDFGGTVARNVVYFSGGSPASHGGGSLAMLPDQVISGLEPLRPLRSSMDAAVDVLRRSLPWKGTPPTEEPASS